MERIDHGHFVTTRHASASIRACKYCKHVEIYRYVGGHRGAGMVGGNKARGRMIQHLKAAHPDKYPGNG
jgi:hypothetical protein